MTSRSLDLPTERAALDLGHAIGLRLRPGDAVLLDGPLGAGKTTIARAILRAACNEPALEVPSPTYTLVQDYESPMGPITHLDLWRLDGPASLEELGWRDARAGAVIVEWPDRLADARPDGALTVTLSHDDSATARSCVIAGWPDERLASLTASVAGSRP